MSITKKYIISIVGPTAVGKTDMSIAVAKHFSTEIINADSRQIYHELNIGTAKPTSNLLGEVKHHFINHVSIRDHYTAGIFEREFLTLSDHLLKKNDLAIISGGTGLFVKAAIQGFDIMPEIPKAVRRQVDQEIAINGLEDMIDELKSKDPEYYQIVDKANSRRISRAIAHLRYSGQKYSHFRNQNPTLRTFDHVGIVLEREREELYHRINLRVDQMIKDGLMDEVKSLEQYKELRALQTVGYKELFSYLNAEYDLDTAIAKIKQNSRRYAKRQMTWNRQWKDWPRFHPDNVKEVINYIEQAVHP